VIPLLPRLPANQACICSKTTLVNPVLFPSNALARKILRFDPRLSLY
jgi:hypothetical protein